jgi:hypothetical protein
MKIQTCLLKPCITMSGHLSEEKALKAEIDAIRRKDYFIEF